MTQSARTPTLLHALVPVGFLIAALAYGVGNLGIDPHVPLILATVAAGLMGLRLGFRWSELEAGLVGGITVAIQACLILLVIGLLIGTWIAAGIICALVLSTLLTCIAMNIVACDQYLSIVTPGRMYRETYARRGLAAVNLSRCLEDGGTLTAPLIPWTTGGAYMANTLGVATGAYLPFAFLNLITPLVSALYGFTGWTMRKAGPQGASAEQAEK